MLNFRKKIYFTVTEFQYFYMLLHWQGKSQQLH